MVTNAELYLNKYKLEVNTAVTDFVVAKGQLSDKNIITDTILPLPTSLLQVDKKNYHYHFMKILVLLRQAGRQPTFYHHCICRENQSDSHHCGVMSVVCYTSCTMTSITSSA